MEFKISPAFSVSHCGQSCLISSAAGSIKLPTLAARGLSLKKLSPGIWKKSTVTRLEQTHSDRLDQRFLTNAASSSSPLFESDQGPINISPRRTSIWWKSVKTGLDAFYRFSRPHTVKGTIISIISISLLPIEKMSDFSPVFFTSVLQAIVAALLMSIYVVGVNQLTDIEIDKVNKPYLPLASGEYSYRTGLLIISSYATMGFALAWFSGSWPLFWAIFIYFMLGSVYSIDMPMLRWKRSGFLAAACILVYRAFVVQLAFYLHVQTFVLQRPAVFSRPVIFATIFMTFFSAVIALFKDIPDFEGDTNFGVQTYTVRLGVKPVFWFCISLLEIAYVLGICVGLVSPNPWSKLVTVFGHSLLALVLWNRAKSTDLKSKTATTAFYMFIWKLFYAEYLLIPLLR